MDEKWFPFMPRDPDICPICQFLGTVPDLVRQDDAEVHHHQRVTGCCVCCTSEGDVDAVVVAVVDVGWAAKRRGVHHLTPFHHSLFSLVEDSAYATHGRNRLFHSTHSIVQQMSSETESKYSKTH